MFTCEDAPSIYDVPRMMAEQDFDLRVCERLGLDPHERDMADWEGFLISKDHAENEGGKHVEVELVDGEALSDDNVEQVLGDASGILVPGGFGKRAFDGKIAAARYAREHQVPYLGICLGMQVAVCEFARDVLGYADASSSEFDPQCAHAVIDLLDEQEGVTEKGGTMRLGAYPCALVAGTLAAEAYGEALVQERHRHRYEFNSAYREELEAAGLVVSGTSPARMARWSRWSSCAATCTRGSSPRRRTPSSRAAPRVRTRCSVSSSARPRGRAAPRPAPVVRRHAGAPRVQEPPHASAPAVP